MKYVEMPNLKVPTVGLGTWSLRGSTATSLVESALDMGYRLVDTAQFYENEAEVGRAIKNSAVKRQDILITTKIWPTQFAYPAFLKAVDQSLKALKQDYIDLLLLHWPSASIPLSETLKALVEVKNNGKVLNIGVSNFEPELLQQAVDYCGKNQIITNQVEYHALLDQMKVLNAVRSHSMFLTAYSPLAQGKVVNHPLLKQIGQKHNKTPAQIALKWLVDQQAVVAIPRSKNRDRLQSFLELFDFDLTDSETEQVNRLQSVAGRIIPLQSI